MPSYCSGVAHTCWQAISVCKYRPYFVSGNACHSVYSPAGSWWVSFNLAPRERL
nr:MAG TPA: hypothetical protein [Caudoviricetes sp.]